jgi:hypothetical protein
MATPMKPEPHVTVGGRRLDQYEPLRNGCRGPHSLHNINGYVVVRATDAKGRQLEPVQDLYVFEGDSSYGDAVQLQHDIEMDRKGLVLIDFLYGCGCRSK